VGRMPRLSRRAEARRETEADGPVAEIRRTIRRAAMRSGVYLCSWSAMVAARAVAVPLQAEDFGSQGLAPVQEAIAAVQAGPKSG
jgi:hypothetical protein